MPVVLLCTNPLELIVNTLPLLATDILLPATIDVTDNNPLTLLLKFVISEEK